MAFVICVALLSIFFTFIAGANKIEFLCELNTIPCSSVGCFDPKVEVCHKVREGRAICRKEEELCVLGEYSREAQCYNADTQVCLRDKGFVWVGRVCLKGERMCGSYKCYNPITQDCHQHIVCKRGELICNGQCYDPKEQQCSTNKLCKITEKACNGECYPPTLDKICFRVTYNENIYKEMRNYTKLW